MKDSLLTQMVSFALRMALGVILLFTGTYLIVNTISNTTSDRKPSYLKNQDTPRNSSDTAMISSLSLTQQGVELPPSGGSVGSSGEASKKASDGDKTAANLPSRPLTINHPPRPREDKETLGNSLKTRLLKTLKNEGWWEDELWIVHRWLEDPRTHYRAELVVRNSTFEEREDQYRKFLYPESIEDCLKMGQKYQNILKDIERTLSVSPSLLLALIKVESNFGQYPGQESLFNVFWSLALGDDPEVISQLKTPSDYPQAKMRERLKRRAMWARGQLRDLVFLYNRYGIDPLEAKASFAGAHGMVQFIPSSIRVFARDGDNDGKIDLNSFPDAAFSAAYYLKENGWNPKGSRQHKRKVLLTYNRSPFYADCVLDLADTLEARSARASLP